MNTLNYQFHRAQARLKNRKAAGDVKGGDAVRPLFQPELTGIEATTNRQRLLNYQNKIAQLEAA